MFTEKKMTQRERFINELTNERPPAQAGSRHRGVCSLQFSHGISPV